MFQERDGLKNEYDTGILSKVFNIKQGGGQTSEYQIIIWYNLCYS